MQTNPVEQGRAIRGRLDGLTLQTRTLTTAAPERINRVRIKVRLIDGRRALYGLPAITGRRTTQRPAMVLLLPQIAAG